MTGNARPARNPDLNGDPLQIIDPNSNSVTPVEMEENPRYSSTDPLIQVTMADVSILRLRKKQDLLFDFTISNDFLFAKSKAVRRPKFNFVR